MARGGIREYSEAVPKGVFLEHPLSLCGYLACLQLNIRQSNWENVGHVAATPS